MKTHRKLQAAAELTNKRKHPEPKKRADEVPKELAVVDGRQFGTLGDEGVPQGTQSRRQEANAMKEGLLTHFCMPKDGEFGKSRGLAILSR